MSLSQFRYPKLPWAAFMISTTTKLVYTGLIVAGTLICGTVTQEYKIHNADLLFKEDSTVDDLIDVIEVLSPAILPA